jgi:hypothetical protein
MVRPKMATWLFHIRRRQPPTQAINFPICLTTISQEMAWQALEMDTCTTTMYMHKVTCKTTKRG